MYIEYWLLSSFSYEFGYNFTTCLFGITPIHISNTHRCRECIMKLTWHIQRRKPACEVVITCRLWHIWRRGQEIEERYAIETTSVMVGIDSEICLWSYAGSGATIDWFRWIRLNELIPLHNWDVVSLVDNVAFHLNEITFEEDVWWRIHFSSIQFDRTCWVGCYNDILVSECDFSELFTLIFITKT